MACACVVSAAAFPSENMKQVTLELVADEDSCYPEYVHMMMMMMMMMMLMMMVTMMLMAMMLDDDPCFAAIRPAALSAVTL